MESSIGYVVLTAFLIFMLMSSTTTMLQYASTSNALSVSMLRSNLLHLVRGQLVETYRGAKIADSDLQLTIAVPKNIQGKTFRIRIESQLVVLEWSGTSMSLSLPSLGGDAIWSESSYISGSGKLTISASYAQDAVTVSLVGG